MGGTDARNIRRSGSYSRPLPPDDYELGHGSDCILLSILSTVYHPLCCAVHTVRNIYGVNT